MFVFKFLFILRKQPRSYYLTCPFIMSVQIGVLASLQIVSDFFDDVLDLGERRSILRVGMPARDHYTLVSEQFRMFRNF